MDVQKLNEQAREASTSTLPKDQRALARIQTRKRKEASAVVMSRRKALLPHLEGITYIHDELGKARTSALGKWWPGDPKYLVKTQLKDYFTEDTRLDESDLKRRRETAKWRREVLRRQRSI